MEKKIFLCGFIAVFILLPYFTFACEPRSDVWNPTILRGPLVSCTGTGEGGMPACQNLCDLICTSANVVYFGIGVVIWIVVPFMFAWGGILFMFSQGNPSRIEAARKMLTGVVIGLAIVLCAYLIVFTFVRVMGISGIGGFGADACIVQ